MKYALEIKIWNGRIDEKGDHLREHSEIKIIHSDDNDVQDVHEHPDWGSHIVEWVDDEAEARDDMESFLESNTDVVVIDHGKE